MAPKFEQQYFYILTLVLIFFNWLKQLQPLQHYYMQQNLQYATYRKGKDLN